MDNFISKFKTIKLVAIMILSIGIILYENINTNRIYIFIGVLLLILLIEILKIKMNFNRILVGTLLFQLALILFLEYYSRYAMNYFIHSLYVILILEISMNFRGKKSFFLGSLTLIIASLKYIYIISIKMSMGSIAQYAFFLTLNVSIMITFNLLQQVITAKKEQEKLQASLNSVVAQEERNRISREIHDTLGHQMVNMIMQLEMININKEIEKISKVISDARETHKILRNIVENNYSDLLDDQKDINSLLDDYQEKTQIKIKKEIDNSIYYPKTIYRIIRESLTNAAKYSEAKNITINLNADNEFIYFSIADNGVGCKNIVPNLGLIGIEKSVELFDGEVRFSGDSGFMVKGFIRRIKND